MEDVQIWEVVDDDMHALPDGSRRLTVVTNLANSEKGKQFHANSEKSKDLYYALIQLFHNRSFDSIVQK